MRRSTITSAALLIALAMLFVGFEAEMAQAQSADCTEGVEVCGFGSSLPSAIGSGLSFSDNAGGTQTIPVGSSIFDGCTWERVLAGDDLVLDRVDIAAVNLTGSTFAEDHYIVFCPHLTEADLTGLDAYSIFPVGGPPPAATVLDMIADAYARTPVVVFNPITSPDGDEDIPLITQMITYLWVDEAAWTDPVTAISTLPIPGSGFSVTTTATPSVALWSGGDEAARCYGDDMVPYVFGIGGDENQPSNCSMVYKRSSAVQDNIIELEVIWDVSYTCTLIPGCGGDLPDIITTGTRDVLVGEILAVES